MLTRNKKINISIATAPDGGPLTYSRLLQEKLPAHGFEVKIFNFGKVLHLPKGISHLVFFLKIFKNAFWTDIFYAQDPVSTGLPMMLAAKLSGKKFFLKIVGDYAWEQGSQRSGVKDLLDSFSEEFEKYSFFVRFLKRVQRSVALSADIVIVPSEYLKVIVSNWGIPKEKITLVYNAFDEPHVYGTKEEIQKELGMSGKIIVSPGRLVPWKGFDTVIMCMPKILEKHPDTMLYVIGEGPDKMYLLDKIKECKVEENVVLAGHVAHSDMLRHLKAADLFVLNTSYEGFSHLILEAMAVEVPIITTPVGGNIEVIEDQVNGLLVPYNERTLLQGAILSLLENREMAHALAKKSREKINQFSESKMLNEIAHLFGK